MAYKIYLIKNEVNGKEYVGMTCQPLSIRWSQHLSRAQGGASYALPRAIRKYGGDEFTILRLDQAESKTEAIELEKDWITKRAAYEGRGYNETPGGEGVHGTYGSDHHSSELTDEEVLEMRRRYVEDDQLTAGKLADQYDAVESTVQGALRGEVWSHVTMPEGMEAAAERTNRANSARGELSGQTALTEQDVLDIRRRYVEEKDLTTFDLADEYDMEPASIGCVVRGDTWSHLPVPDGLDQAIRAKKYRSPEGSEATNSILTEEKVLWARRKYVNDETVSASDLGDELGVRGNTVQKLLRGHSWSHVPMPDGIEEAFAARRAGENHSQAKLSDAEVLEVRRRYDQEDTSYNKLADQYGVSGSGIGGIVRGETRIDAGGPIQ